MNYAFTLSIALLLVPLAGLRAADAPKPNVVYIMADDLGWGDISVHGGRVPTPNIDRLFSRGVELTQFMGWCVCSPTRAMLLTGRHPTFTIYLDNLRIRHADGSTTPLWTSGKGTRAGAFKASELFKDLQVRTVNVAEVGK